MVRDLSQRPVVPQIEIQNRLLVRGEERAISLEEREVPAPSLQGVKVHYLTV